jgi:hypothetical protein
MTAQKNLEDDQVPWSETIKVTKTNDISSQSIFDYNMSRTVIGCNEVVIWEISNWIVTIIQACLATVVGLYIVLTCVCERGNTDIIYGYRCKLVEIYLWILWAYFISDILRLLRIYQLKYSNLNTRTFSSFLKQGNNL